ncbi:antibiotic biosynthesis monooxygenase [Thermoleptolyngbya sp. C42_A2020_037]|uniref:antibiotic biosynthesis monooxygenase n=1 Tax=Thermoleptolyngbya sp. C42_A2020_037 TaxID=2747799 RepID=UPI0019F4CF29|nr:antibiotic biosynthesis monooxygenase [Thermoleptolyngbya sp. C42_A2020_037]MBF2087107.1 antibiotic biosynthesis monooxygenase [Thermoleptolyngbya sp. C42_A2020_037]
MHSVLGSLIRRLWGGYWIRSVFAIGLVLWFGFGGAIAAYADKAPQVLVFDTEPEAVSVLSVYETTPDTQLNAVSTVLKSSKAFFKGAEGFKGLSVLQSEDGSRVVALTQWTDAASYEAFMAQPVEDYTKYQKEYQKESSKGGQPPMTVTPAKTEVFELADMQIPSGMVPVIRGQGALVQLGEVSVAETEDLPEVLSEVEQALPAVTKMYPAPRSVILLKSVDNSEALLMAYWGYAEEFQDLAQVPAVDVLSGLGAVEAEDGEEAGAIALPVPPKVDQHLYKVVNVIAPKPPKQYSKKSY